MKSGRNEPYRENSCPHRQGVKMERAVWRGEETVIRKEAVRKWERRAITEGGKQIR